ncbi:hypothetical protein [Pseudomonas sp. NPDC089734]|uniref:hypothetical protein n=1 Tax=Pseudomonas sp. NPDC089734 TaxID=3364469 RepID=UPI0037FBF61A
MIPEYRVKIYCLLGAFFCIGCAFFVGSELFEAMRTLELDIQTGPRSNRVKEHLIYSHEPLRFVFYFFKTSVVSMLFMIAGLCMAWRMVRGRKAFKGLGRRQGA